MVLIRKSLFLILLFPLFIFSQKIDSAYVSSINLQVSRLRYEGKFDEAYKKSNALLSQLQKGNYNQIFYAETYFNKSRIEIELGEYEEAFKTSQYAFEIYSKNSDSIGLAQVYNLIGVYHYYQNNLDSTLIYYVKSYDLKKKFDFSVQELAVSAYNIAMVYEDIGMQQEAMNLYFESEKYLLQDKDFKSFLPDVYIGIAHIYKYRQDFDQAEKFADKAMDVGLKTYGEFNPNMTFVYTSYANILISKKKYKEAIELIKKGLEIREKNYGVNHKWTCESYADLAEVYEFDGQIDLAEAYFKKSIQIGSIIKSNLYLANAKNALGAMYADQKMNTGLSEKLLKEALVEYKKIYGEKNDIITSVYYNLAKNAKNRNDKDAFFSYVNLAYASGNYDTLNLNKIIAPFEVLETLSLHSDWLKQDFDKNKIIDVLKNRFDLIDQQIGIIKILQKNYSSEISKISLANNYRDVFEKGLNTCWILFQKTNEKKYLEKAFEISETNRNTTLLAGLQESKFKLYGAIPINLLVLESQIKHEFSKVKMDLYYAKTSSNPDKEQLSNLIHKRTEVSRKLDSLLLIFHKDYPKYANLKYENKIISIADVQKNIDYNTQLITYFLGENNLYTFNITKNKIVLFKEDNVKNLSKEIDTLKNKLVHKKDLIASTKKLYDYLLCQQLNQNKPNLIVIPDNILNYIPFEILQNETNKYVIQDFTISYSGSVRLYLELKNEFFKYSLPNYWAGFSPNYILDKTLSSNIDEISEIAELVNGNSFIGEASSKKNFYKNYRENSILHFAMHAEIDNNNPLYNKLIFSDGDLTASEIYVSNIKANLAVLSACNTGFGKLEKGEGVMSMARAFNFAGVPSVIMSLWKVPDKETKKIMVSFYKHLSKGEAKNTALKNAKLEYLLSTDDENLRHPYYWSGFVLNGNTDTLVSKAVKINYYYLGALVLFGSFFVMIRFKKNQFK